MPLTWGALPSVKTEPVKGMNFLKWNCLLRTWNMSPLLWRKFSLYNVTSKYTKFFLGGLYDWHNQCAFWSYVYVCVCVLLHLKWLLGLMGSGVLWIILDSLVSFPLCLPLSSKLIYLVFLTSHGWWFFSWEKNWLHHEGHLQTVRPTSPKLGLCNCPAHPGPRNPDPFVSVTSSEFNGGKQHEPQMLEDHIKSAHPRLVKRVEPKNFTSDSGRHMDCCM